MTKLKVDKLEAQSIEKREQNFKLTRTRMRPWKTQTAQMEVSSFHQTMRS